MLFESQIPSFLKKHELFRTKSILYLIIYSHKLEYFQKQNLVVQIKP